MRSTVFAGFIALAVIALGFAARNYFSGHQVPMGQPPLARLDGESLSSLKAEFNRSANGVRVILLLSPT
jgi:hypothetical protein